MGEADVLVSLSRRWFGAARHQDVYRLLSYSAGQHTSNNTAAPHIISHSSAIAQTSLVSVPIIIAPIQPGLCSALLCYMPYKGLSLVQICSLKHGTHAQVSTVGLSYSNRPQLPPCKDQRGLEVSFLLKEISSFNLLEECYYFQRENTPQHRDKGSSSLRRTTRQFLFTKNHFPTFIIYRNSLP